MADFQAITKPSFKAIETCYKNRRFRSRLEARYAVLFDALKIKWEYEMEGFEIANGVHYLPDFWLPYPDEINFSGHENAGHWIEIKGTMPTVAEKGNLLMLSIQSNHSGMILVGPPGEHKRFITHRSGNYGWHEFYPPHGENKEEYNIFLTFMRFLLPENHKLISLALQKALGARFEFGEKG